MRDPYQIIPTIKENRPHWKVGDTLSVSVPCCDPLAERQYTISQIVLAETTDKEHFELTYYGPAGNRLGSQKLRLDK